MGRIRDPRTNWAVKAELRTKPGWVVIWDFKWEEGNSHGDRKANVW